MRGRTLGELKAQLRAELRQSANAAVAQSADHILVGAIKGAQGWVYDQHDWPHLRTWRDVSLEAGSNKYDWPTEMDYDRVELVRVYWGNRWVPVEQLVDPIEYAGFDSDAGERADPVMKYRIVDDDQFEVWPIPAGAQRLRIVGIKRAPELIGDTSKCTFDDQLIVTVAAGRLSAGKAAAKDLENRALSIMGRLMNRASTAQNFSIGGNGGQPKPRRELVIRIAR